MRVRVSSFLMLLSLTGAPALHAQTAPPPPKVWTEAASAGFAFTGGNSDTSTLNIGYEVTYDPKATDPTQRNLVKSDGLFLRGKTEGELSTERLGLNGRDEYSLSNALFVFGQTQYLRDRFKEIDYLVAPTGGLGYRVFDTPQTKLSLDTGLGVVWEKNTFADDVDTSGAFTYSEKFQQALTATTTLTQSLSALHKTSDFGDSLYQIGFGVAAALTSKTQLKVEFLDTYKNKVPDIGIVKNDTAVVLALVYKN